MNTQTMSPADFHAAAAHTRLSSETLRALRMILVDGIQAARAAEQCNVSRQHISRGKKRLIEAHENICLYPVHWITLTLTVPPELAEKFTRQARQAKKEI